MRIKRKEPLQHDQKLLKDEELLRNKFIPTDSILIAEQRFKKIKFRDDLDNEAEDSCSDDDFVMMIKNAKCREATKRADIITEA